MWLLSGLAVVALMCGKVQLNMAGDGMTVFSSRSVKGASSGVV
jgi:hypothetical protein